eukprot:TRINITY_DN7497_c0_g1_i1.p1 TRINITY_DN7497_c0_g1~~TRINITY_DN7497_c0_g1_i1.p1  ORF type:complete len:401 (+),score=28.69 TRINITY_DN7497_c0_g1_i1:43-1245(+)
MCIRDRVSTQSTGMTLTWGLVVWVVGVLVIGCESGEELRVVYVKTHKTASSTIANILARYAQKRNLPLWYPPQLDFRGQLTLFTQNNIPPVFHHNVTYNIWNAHALYEEIDWLRNWVPGATALISFREPISRWYSHYSWAAFLHPGFSKHRPLDYIDFLRDSGAPLVSPSVNYYAYSMCGSAHNLDACIDKSIADISSGRVFVFLMEYFDESLLLFRKRFGLDFEDLIYFKQKYRGFVPSSELQQLLLPLLPHDYRIYYAAKRRVLNEMAKYNNLDQDLQKLRSMQQRALSQCARFEEKDSIKPKDRDRALDCQLLLLSNDVLFHFLRKAEMQHHLIHGLSSKQTGNPVNSRDLSWPTMWKHTRSYLWYFLKTHGSLMPSKKKFRSRMKKNIPHNQLEAW